MALPIHTPVKIIARNSRHFEQIGIITNVNKGPRTGKNVYNVDIAYSNGTVKVPAVMFDEDILKLEGNHHDHRN